MTPRRALGILIGATALVRLAWAACLGAGNDEAYHYLFAVHPDWSYYDHPPMIAVVERLGLIASGGAPSVLALRAGFIALFAGATALMARLGRRVAGGDGWAGVLAAVILNATAYYGLAAGTFALPDGPLIFFWLLALDRLLAALERPERLGPWLLVGLAWGGAMLSKYHAVFLPAGAVLYFLLEPGRRACLRRPGPYLAAAVGLGLFVPVIAWNAAHGWASFAFQSGRAMGSAVPRPDRLAAFLAGQAAYLLPWIWAALLAALWRRRGLLPGGPGDPAERFLLAQAVPPLAAFAAVACLRPVLPHWSLVGFLPLMPLAGRDWSALRASDPRRLRRRVATVLAVPVLGASLFVGQARWGWLQRGGRATLNLLAPAHDPTLDLYGWDQVADQLRRRGLTGRDGSFLFTSRWFLSGHLAFALGDGAPVLCYNPAGAHAFAHWSRPEQWVGRDGILVVVDSSPNEPQIYDRWFERIEPLGGFNVRRAGGTVRTVQLYRCVRQLRPFPFDGRELPPTRPPRGRNWPIIGGENGDGSGKISRLRGRQGPPGNRVTVQVEIRSVATGRPTGQLSKVIGLYQILLRRALGHFFPDAVLEPIGDRSVIRLNGDGGPAGPNFRIADEPDGGMGLEIEWFRSLYLFQPGPPIPFSAAERRLVQAVAEALDQRFRSLYDPEVAHRADQYQYPIEDLAVARYLGTPAPDRIPEALEALRVAALSTYENRRVSTGVLLLGTESDPSEPRRANPPGAPRYNVHLAALKSVHRLCDGLRTVFLVDRNGDLAWPVDLARWAREVQGPARLPAPCSRPYEGHARATLTGGHVVLVLSPAQEVRVFAHGMTTFTFSDGRWRLSDLPTCFDAWREALGRTRPPGLAARIFQAALNLGEQRHGALFVVLRDTERSIPQLLAPEDRILEEPAADDPDDPDNLSPRLAKRALHHLVRGRDLSDVDDTVLEALAGIDGAVVTDPQGRLLSFGAILRVTPETVLAPRAVQGSRTTAALAASYHVPVLKVSEDGFLAMYLGGRHIWEI